MRVRIKNIPLETSVKTEQHHDTFVVNMFAEGIFEAESFCEEWYIVEVKRRDGFVLDYNYHISWLIPENDMSEEFL